MNNNNILKKIRIINLKKFLVSLIPALLFNIPFILFVLGMVEEGFNGTLLFFTIIFGIFAMLIDYSLIKTLILVLSPEKSDVLKKYGNVSKISNILEEIEQTKEYEDNNLIISENYISDKKDIEKIVKCSDVLGIHKLVHKTNFVVDYFNIVITDKYGHETSYKYNSKQEELCDKLIMYLNTKCKNAEIGYHKDEWDHIDRNRIKLPHNVEDNNYYHYKCPNCNTNVEYEDKFCKNCAYKLNWKKNEKNEEFKAVFKSKEEKEIEQENNIRKKKNSNLFWNIVGIIILSVISSEIILMIILGDMIEGTVALLLTFVCAIPLFGFYYYLFIIRNNRKKQK